ncbi:hypothetical protein ABPG75_012044 [Micractinium tetrahymenae]
MLQRKPTRIELKSEDKAEYEAVREERRQAELQAAAQAAGKAPLSPLFLVRRRRLLPVPPPMVEVEVKLRLADAAAHGKVAEALRPGYRTTHQQENYFFDGAAQELSSRRVVLRVRFYNQDKKAVITVKGKQVLQDGIGRAPEEEEAVVPALARSFLAEPAKLLALGTPLLEGLKSSAGVQQLVCLGGFDNTRQEFEWGGHLLELDETKFEWGTLYELECETAEPERLRGKLESFLTGLGAAYSYSTTTKFANFRNRTLQ